MRYQIELLLAKPRLDSLDVTWFCNTSPSDFQIAKSIAQQMARALGLRKRPRKWIWQRKYPDGQWHYPMVFIFEIDDE